MKKSIYHFLLLVSLILCAPCAMAQDISVESFRLLDKDMTAITPGTQRYDRNGDAAALIKVVTTETGFVFDVGLSGIVGDVEEKVGETWVYVPYGINRISIMHKELGVLRDYNIPISIQKARTYEMVLTTNRLVTTIERKASKQYVMFNVSPTSAVIELDGMPLEVVDGYAEKSMPYGTYDYRVSCANYHTEAGKLTVSSAGKVEKTISLRPNFGWIDLRATSDHHGAHVYIDGERIGQLPLKSDVLKSGTYKVKVLKPLYKPFEQQVTVTDNNTTTLNVVLVPNFANITLTTDAESEIWVDGRQRGKGKCTIGLEEGEYTVEVKRPSHRTVSDVITVSELTDRTIQLPSPTPIYGVLDISSTPSRATVLVDGVEVGQTPLILNKVLVGAHKVAFKREGYESYEKTIELAESADNTLVVTLEPKKAQVQNANMKRSDLAVKKRSGLAVKDFRLLENDLTANTHGTMEKDFNGETAALIKVVTPEKGFVFAGGMVGIVKTKQMTGEVWVYVPHGIKKISIMHESLGVLRDYYFPVSIEKGRTYVMILDT